MGRTANEVPAISEVAGLIADPARARMLSALMGGVALTATELALHGGVSSSTASSHLAKLAAAKMVTVVPHGRHRYFRLHDDDVASLLEQIGEFASRDDRRRKRPADPALAAARVCYDHLAGVAGVWLADQLRERDLVTGRDAYRITSAGEHFFAKWGIDLDACASSRRPLVRTCLDWTERRFHIAGSLGAAMLQRIFDLRWARRDRDSRALTFTPSGERSFRSLFG